MRTRRTSIVLALGFVTACTSSSADAADTEAAEAAVRIVGHARWLEREAHEALDAGLEEVAALGEALGATDPAPDPDRQRLEKEAMDSLRGSVARIERILAHSGDRAGEDGEASEVVREELARLAYALERARLVSIRTREAYLIHAETRSRALEARLDTLEAEAEGIGDGMATAYGQLRWEVQEIEQKLDAAAAGGEGEAFASLRSLLTVKLAALRRDLRRLELLAG